MMKRSFLVGIQKLKAFLGTPFGGVFIFALMFSSHITFGEDKKPVVIRRPIVEYYSIVEYSCIKHIRESNLERARANLNVMNDICSLGLTGYVMPIEGLAEFESSLQEAKAAKQQFMEKNPNGQWICNPQKKPVSVRKQLFYGRIGPTVKDFLRQKNVSDEMIFVVIAHIAHETGWGERIEGNNLFNIKGSYNGTSTQFSTHEYISDQRVSINDSFRSYPEIVDSVKDYLSTLQTKWPDSYVSLFTKAPSVSNFINGLKAGSPGGYATDPNYNDKLGRIAKIIEEEFESSLSPLYKKCM